MHAKSLIEKRDVSKENEYIGSQIEATCKQTEACGEDHAYRYANGARLHFIRV